MEEFLETGRTEIEAVMQTAAQIPFAFNTTEKALDFGCGPGRLVQALANYFTTSIGVDVAPSMIQTSEEINRLGERCQFFLNERDDLSLFQDDDLDMIYSSRVLQHIHPTYSRVYIREFTRILKPGGLAVFQVPSEAFEMALPKQARQAELIALAYPTETKTNDEYSVKIQVRNSSDLLWPEQHYLRLYSNWLHGSGEVVRRNKERTDIECAVAGGETVVLELAVVTPPIAGKYLLELDIMQEDVACFKEYGSEPLLLPIKVIDEKQPSLPEIVRLNILRLYRLRNFFRDHLHRPPIMEVHGLPQNEVVELIEGAGGRILMIEEDFVLPAWHGFKYYVTKDGSG